MKYKLLVLDVDGTLLNAGVRQTDLWPNAAG